MSRDEPAENVERVYRLDPCWPVLPGPRYRGLVWNHDKLPDGTLITTSAVVELMGGRISTRSGSVYELGRTFNSQDEALAKTGGRLGPRKSDSGQPPLQVLDLEADDLSVIDTFAHSKKTPVGRSQD
jgi:hypothetical protein